MYVYIYFFLKKKKKKKKKIKFFLINIINFNFYRDSSNRKCYKTYMILLSFNIIVVTIVVLLKCCITLEF